MPTMNELPRVPRDPVKRSRYRGCLLGGAVGDALGAVVEFMTLGEIHARFGQTGIRNLEPAYGRVGAITDDTQMALFTADGMMRAHVRSCLRGIGPAFRRVTAHAYLRWLRTQGTASPLLEADAPQGWLMTNRDLFHRRAPGNTCLSALMQMKSLDTPARNNSKGCGGAMRAAPVGMFTANWATDSRQDGQASPEIDSTFGIGVDIAAVTHGHPTGQLAAGMLAAIISQVLSGSSLPEAVGLARAQLATRPGHEETLASVDAAVALAGRGPGNRKDLSRLGEGWVAEEALAIGLYCALTSTDFESAIVLAVNHDGDSDSTGSIAGNLLGALMGVEAIPDRWLAPLELRQVICSVADDLGSIRDWRIGDGGAEEEFYWERYPGA